MPKIVRSAEARADLANIAVYIAKDDIRAADRWLDSVDRLLRLIAANPAMGELVEQIRPGQRRQTHGNYLLFYAEHRSGILLYRVLHGARPIEDILLPTKAN